jgi:hypothetical protein
MPPSQIIGFSPVTLGSGIPAGVQRALVPLNTLNAVGLSLEAYSQLPVMVAGFFDRGFTQIADNTLDAASSLAVRRSMANMGIEIQVNAGQTGAASDGASSVSFAANDSLAWGLDTRGASAGLINPMAVALRFLPDDPSQTVSWAWTGGSGGGFSADNTTRYASISGTVGFQTNEAFAKARIHGHFIVGQQGVEVATNKRITPIVYRSRINGINGNHIITVPPGYQGRLFSDPSAADVLQPGDTFNYSATTGGGGGAFNVRWISAPFISAARQWIYAATNVNAANILAAGGPRYVPFAGNLANAHPSEALAQVPTFAQRVSKLSMFVSANNATTPTIVRTGLTGITAVIAPGQTEWIEKLIDVHDIPEGGFATYQIIPGGGSGQVVFRTMTLIGETVGDGPVPVPSAPRLLIDPRD